MRNIIVLIALVTFVSTATALQCFLCIGSTESDCANGVESAMAVQNCDASLGLAASLPKISSTRNGLIQQRDDVPIVTTCVSFAATDGTVVGVERGCGFIWEDVDLCSYLGTLVELNSCSTCDEDLCNTDPIA